METNSALVPIGASVSFLLVLLIILIYQFKRYKKNNFYKGLNELIIKRNLTTSSNRKIKNFKTLKRNFPDFLTKFPEINDYLMFYEKPFKNNRLYKFYKIFIPILILIIILIIISLITFVAYTFEGGGL